MDLPQLLQRAWVEVVVASGHVRSIEIVLFDPATLDRVHFVAGGFAEFYQQKTGESLYVDDEVRPDWTVPATSSDVVARSPRLHQNPIAQPK